jgi:hypothetical protein
MATTPNDAADNTAIAGIKSALEAAQQKLDDLTQQRDDIDARINSWSLAVWQGLGRLTEVDEKKLMFAPNETLTKEQLQQKRTLIVELLAQQNTILGKLSQQYGDLERQDQKGKLAAAEREFAVTKKQVEEKFRENPDKFYTTYLPHMPITQERLDVVYDSANHIIAACEAFPSETNRYKILEAWSVVAQARDRAFARYQEATKNPKTPTDELRKLSEENDKYFKGAKHVFSVLSDKGPSGLQGAKFLYDQRMYEQAEYYLNRAVIDQPLIDKLTAEVNAVCEKQALGVLSAIPNFKQLPQEVRDQLVTQQAFLTKFTFDLDSVPDSMREQEFAKLQKYKERLRDNIKNVIANYKDPASVTQQFAKLKAEIDHESNEIRRRWFSVQFSNNFKVSMGAGLGIAWVVGAGTPIGAAIGLAISNIVSNLEVSAGNLQIPVVEADTALLNEVAPEDYNFIKRTAAAWQQDSIEKSASEPVAIKTFKEQVTDKVQQKKQEMKDKIKAAADDSWKENLDPVLENLNAKGTRLYLYVVGFITVVLVALVVALPVAWPVVAVAAGLGAIGFGYLYAQKAKNPSEPLDHELGGLVDATYDAIEPVRAKISRAFTVVLVNPLQNFARSFMNLFTPSPSSRIMKFTTAETENTSAFAFSPEAMKNLQKMSPHFGVQLGRDLVAHFERRAAEIQRMIDEVRSETTSAYTASAMGEINSKLDMLETDWASIKDAAKSPETFLQEVEQYLEKTFKIEQNEYLQAAKVRKAQGYDFTKERKTMSFDDKVFDIKLPEKSVDYAHKQKAIEELLELKQKFSKFKTDY